MIVCMIGGALGLATALSLVWAPTPEPPATTTSSRRSALNSVPKWEYRRVGLMAGLVISSGIAVSGAILAASFAGRDRECFVTCLAATPMIAFGSAGTAVFAPWVHHHNHWDDPRLRARPEAAKIRRRQLWTAFGISSGVAVAGLTTWVTPLFVPACEPFYDRACGAAAVSGAAILAVGSGGMVSTGMALLLHRIHRHRAVEVKPGVAGVSVRF